jgi:hypothetical protein
MSTDETSPKELRNPGPPDTSRGAAIYLIVILVALAALVWELKPDRPNVQPAPLQPQDTTCPQATGQFTPTNITDLPGLDLASLSRERRNHVLLRLNMEPCACGCNGSVAFCLANHARCEECRQRAKEIIAEEQGTTR